MKEILPQIAGAGTRPGVTPVLRPLLPLAERLLPYLRIIDANRIYTNFGPLALELSRRLTAHFLLPNDSVVVAASGTAALIGAILGSAGRAQAERPLAVIPGLTFVATAAAAEACGYRLHLMDVDPESFLLDPARLLLDPEINRVNVVIPVAAFGRPVDQADWRQFREKTGIAVVIDGAASFEAATASPRRLLGDIPVAMSFHATKSFATGEGGCVVTSDVHLAYRILQALNFGFLGSRDSQTANINGKMSEYHAAVGLAELDGWSAKAKALSIVAKTYRRHFTRFNMQHRFIGPPDIASCYALFQCETIDEAQRVESDLQNEHIEFRFWYGNGIHRQSYYSNLRHGGLPITERLAARLIGLPIAPDLTEKTIARISTILAMSVGTGPDALGVRSQGLPRG